jgi:hypothetical protein
MTAAYDYAKQCWVEGRDAVVLRLRQLRSDLTILEGPDGQAFLDFTGSKTPLADAIANCRARIAELEVTS